MVLHLLVRLVRLVALHIILCYDFLLILGDDNFFDLVVVVRHLVLLEVATDALREDLIEDF